MYTFKHHLIITDQNYSFPASFSSFSWSLLPLCDFIRKWTAFFRWLALPNIPCRKKDACWRPGLGSAHGMSCHKWPLADLLIWPQRVKAAFWCLGVLASPGKCPWMGRRTHPQLRLLPQGAHWRLSQALLGGPEARETTWQWEGFSTLSST